MRQAAAAVEQPRDGVREQRAAGDRPGDDVGGRDETRRASGRAGPARSARSSTGAGTAGAGSGRRGRDSRCRSRSARRASAPRSPAGPSAPSRGSSSARLTRISSCLQRLEWPAARRPPASQSRPRRSRTRRARRRWWRRRRPRSCQPSNGVFFDFERKRAAVDGDRQVGREHRDVGGRAFGTSAPPGTPRMRAGLTDSSSTRRRSPMRPPCTRRSSAQRHGGLEPDDAERRAVELDVSSRRDGAARGRSRSRRRCRRRSPRASRRGRPSSRSGGFILTLVS